MAEVRVQGSGVWASFDGATGAWLGLGYGDGGESVIGAGAAPFELVVDDGPFLGERRRPVEVELLASGTAAVFVYERDGVRVTHTVEVDGKAPVLRQQVTVACLDGRDPRLLTHVVYRLPGIAVGDPCACLYQAPGQLTPIDTPYGEAVRQCARQGSLNVSPAPCHSAGIVAVENRGLQRIVSAWLISDQAVTFPIVRGDGERLTVEHRHHTAAWLRPGVEVTSMGYGVLLTEGGLDDHLARFRSSAYGPAAASATDVPAWWREARVFQLPPYPLSEWAPRLPAIRDMGFNVLYLCPVQATADRGWYNILDHYAISERVGTAAELRAFVDGAHALGLRVIFDYLPQGVSVESPFVDEHPDWLVRDAYGRTYGSHGWGPRAGAPCRPNRAETYSLDWGNPDYRRFAIDWAIWFVEAFDIDGLRCDAMHWKEPNLASDHPRPAWLTIYGGVRILEALRHELRAIKPDVALLSEVWGPIFQPTTDGSYENGAILQAVNESWLGLREERVMTAQQYQAYLRSTEAARPEGYLRASFTANHDMQPLGRAARGHPLGDAVSFIHAFSASIPFVMWLEPEGREAFFTALMRERAALGDALPDYGAATSDASGVFLTLWRGPDQAPVLAAASLSTEALDVTVALPAASAAPRLRFGCPGAAAEGAGTGLRLVLPPGGYALIDL